MNKNTNKKVNDIKKFVFIREHKRGNFDGSYVCT